MGGRRSTRSATRPLFPVSFNAFMSYSHAVDGRLAPALQQALHSFAKPWYRLRGVRVFRDEASLSANPQLWMSIQRALDSSDFFILLASSGAARSEWVQREIAHRTQARGTENFLIVLTDGEIAWDDATRDFDWGATTALPPSLAGTFNDEPRFIDLRWASRVDQLGLRNTRFRDDVAELAGPLHGREKDELIGEDVRQHRRTVRLARTAVASLVALTGAALSGAVVAVDQRDSARHQTLVATSRQLAASALTQQETRLDRSLLLSVEAIRLQDTPEARGALLGGLQATTGLVRSRTVDGAPLAVAWSPDGRTLATGGTAGVVQLWDAESGDRIGDPFRGHDKPVESVTFSPDGRVLASASSDTSIVLWDVAMRQPIGARLLGHREGVERVAFSPDGRMLASAGDDRKIVLWDVATGRANGPPLEGHDAAVRSVAFTPDGALLVSASFDSTVAVWDVAERRRVAVVHHDNALTAVAIAPGGGDVASASIDGTVKIWDVRTGHERAEPLLVENGTTSLAISGDGRLLVAGTYSGALTIWDLGRQRRIGELTGAHESRVNDISFRPESSTVLASVGEDGTVAYWRTDARSRVGTPLQGDVAWVKSVAFSSDGRLLAAAMGNGTVALWDVQARRTQTVLRGHQGVVTEVAFSPDGRRLASAAADGSVRLWDPRSERQIGEPLRGHDGEVGSVAFSRDGKLLATAGDDGKVVIWDADAGRPLHSLLGHTGEVTSVAFGRDSQLASTGVDGTVFVWDAESGRPSGGPLRGHGDRRVNAVAFSSGGRQLATAGADRTIVVWDVKTSQRLRALSAHAADVNSVAFSADDRLLASGSVDHTVVLWDIASGRSLGQPLRGHDGPVESVRFDPSGTMLASASLDYTMVLWDVSLPSWTAQACAVAGRSLTESEWAQFVGSGRIYHRACGEARGG